MLLFHRKHYILFLKIECILGIELQLKMNKLQRHKIIIVEKLKLIHTKKTKRLIRTV